MKNLKHIILGLSIMGVVASCEEAEAPFLGEVDDIAAGIKNGAWLNSIVTVPVLDVTDIENAYFEAELADLTGDVASYDLRVNLNGGDTVDLKTLTEFSNTRENPTVMRITSQEIATALGISTADFAPGDRIEIVATITSTDGTVTRVWPLDEVNVGPDLLANAGQRQSLSFTTYVSCPFSSDEAAGSYEITADPFWGTTGGTLTVEAGPEEGQLTMVDPFGFAPGPDGEEFKVVVDVDPATGIATVDQQAAWDSGAVGFPYGIASVEGDGFAFSCSGQIALNLEHTVSIGGWGFWGYEAAK